MEDWQNKEYDFQTGELLLFNKPLNWTSFDLVNKLRVKLCRYLNVKKLKVGHAGTLDPLATGLVIICTGKATKQIDSYLGQDKEYYATIKLGATTPSFDLETEEDNQFPTEHINEGSINTVLNSFLGETDQQPPTFSALKVNGKKAYDYARSGKEVILTPRKIVIHEIELLQTHLPYIDIRVICSKGTYIRALARDIGEKLNSGGHLTALKRTKSGAFNLSDALEIEEFANFLDKIETNRNFARITQA